MSVDYDCLTALAEFISIGIHSADLYRNAGENSGAASAIVSVG